MKYTEYIKQRFKEMKDDPEFKDMKPSEKTQIIASEWKNKDEVTEIVTPEPEPEKEPEAQEQAETDPEKLYKYKCECGYYFNDPIPKYCPKCGRELQ